MSLNNISKIKNGGIQMKKTTIRILSVIIATALLVSSLVTIEVLASGGTTYYISSSTGSDSYNGTSQSTPWQTLSKLSNTTFQPGDNICLASGDTFTAGFTPSCSGNESNPITLTSYGTGARPQIKLNGSANSWCITIHNQKYWNFNNLELCNAENGIVFNNTDTTTFTDTTTTYTGYNINNCYFHDLVKTSPDWDWTHVGQTKWGSSIGVVLGSNFVDGVNVTNCFTQNCDSFMEGCWTNSNIVGCTSQGCPYNTFENLLSGTLEECVFSNNGGQKRIPII